MGETDHKAIAPAGGKLLETAETSVEGKIRRALPPGEEELIRVAADMVDGGQGGQGGQPKQRRPTADNRAPTSVPG